VAQYGIPYQGSKSGICDELIRVFPKAENFYDVFGGGFSVTHAMLVRRPKDYQRFFFNEIRPGVCGLIERAICGEFNYDRFKPEWIGREEFFARKDHDPYAKIIWSFGNNGEDYLFGKEIEPYKKSLHEAIIFNRFDATAKETLGISQFADGIPIKDRRFFMRNRIKFLNVPRPKQQLQQLQQLLQLERLQRLERLEQLQQLERLAFSSLSYDQIEFLPNSIVYCDPPYAGTADYGNEFDTPKFFDWADAQSNPVFISEYKIEDDRFVLVGSRGKLSKFSSSSRELKQERIYVNRAGAAIFIRASQNESADMVG